MVQIKKIADLFRDKPRSWWLRGDPYLWEEMLLHFEREPMPSSEGDLLEKLDEAFLLITGHSLTNTDGLVFVEKLSHGGMSSGQIDPEFWRNTIFPLLVDRFRSSRQKMSLRIGTWNVWYAFENRLPGIRSVLEENPADIWVLTETHDDLIPSGCDHVVHSQPRPKNWSGIRAGSRWTSIWSKYPLEPLPFDLADDKRTAVAMVDLGDKGKLIVYATVMPWKDDQVPGWSEHHRVINEQINEWEKIHAAFPGVPICIAGDYNSDMSDGRRYGTKAGVEALEFGLAKCQMFCATSPGRFPDGLLKIKPIDHIAIPLSWQHDFAISSAWNADKDTHSDHSGMIVEVSI